MHAYQYYGIGILDNRPIDGDGFQCSSSSASNDDYDDEPLLKKLWVLLCMPWNAPECASEHLKLPKFPEGVSPQDPSRVDNCRAAMFSTSANDIAPQMDKVMYGPAINRNFVIGY